MVEQPESNHALRQLADLRGMPVLCILHDQSNDEVIDQDCADQVHQLLRRLGHLDSLCVVIDSPGGNIDSAYRIARTIRESARYVDVLVPFWAKSAATLICVSANRILLGSTGEMGPLDVQLPDAAGGQQPRSALETFQGLEQLGSYALEVLGRLIEYFEHEEELGAPHTYERAEALFGAIVSPLYQQVDPHELGELGRYQASSQAYATRVMKRWSYSDFEEERIEEIAQRLVWEYPTHGFVIDLYEAQEMGLRVGKLDPETERLCVEITNATPGLIDVSVPTAEVNKMPVSMDADTVEE